MSIKKLSYEQDLTGQNENNRITEEMHTISETKPSNQRYIVPNAAPFFTHNVELYRVNENTNELVKLSKYADWKPILRIDSALDITMYEICTAIALLDSSLHGRFAVSYSPVGGDFTVNSELVVSELANYLANPLEVSYDDLLGKPALFPPGTHFHDEDNIDGMGELITSVNNLTYATEEYMANAITVFNQHVTDETLHYGSSVVKSLAYLKGSSYATADDVNNARGGNKVLVANLIPDISKHANQYTDETNAVLLNLLNDISDKISEWKNYPTPSKTADYNLNNNLMYTLVSDIYKIINSLIADANQAANAANITNLVTPKVMHDILDKYLLIDAISSNAGSSSMKEAASIGYVNAIAKKLDDFINWSSGTINHINNINSGLIGSDYGLTRGIDGQIIQYGVYRVNSTLPESDIRITFPIAFPRACNVVTASRMIAPNGGAKQNDAGVLVAAWDSVSAIIHTAVFSGDNSYARGSPGWLLDTKGLK